MAIEGFAWGAKRQALNSKIRFHQSPVTSRQSPVSSNLI
ncbi:hypothetical protein CKA32_005060 [Geitlerinema sp. FC II]|nr:hypothetical protein CKA32_005060 [Geitlerinema sp. FC II]